MRENTDLTDQIHHSKEAQMSSPWQQNSQGPPCLFPQTGNCIAPSLMKERGEHTKNSEFGAMRKGLKTDQLHETFYPVFSFLSPN